MITNLTDFFNEHADAETAYEALGCFFETAEQAQKFLGGTSVKNIINKHSKGEGIVFAKKSDRIKREIADQEMLAEQAHQNYDSADTTVKGKAMDEWDKQKKVLSTLRGQLTKQLKLEAAEKAEGVES